MIKANLFEQVLIDPARENSGGQLLIVSGFATASMADRHMSVLRENGIDVQISLIVGMTHAIRRPQHIAFQGLVENNPYGIEFNCRYACIGNHVHAKTYLYLDRHGDPKHAFCGSANYTQNGFGTRQIETLSPADPKSVEDFHLHIRSISTSCFEHEIEDVPPPIQPENRLIHRPSKVLLPLVIVRTGETHRAGGLNWGQRENRERNQAYIPIPSHIRNSDFFPPLGERFAALADDGKFLIFARAQQGAKALHTPLNNSEIGKYFRKRLGVPLGERVERQHLLDYGRLNVGFTKFDDETYQMDFSPNPNSSVEP